ncbi:MAG TPA: hypothetical protein VK991_00305 [Halomonas sp.]|nr:hypothetical protein [Halomonas sp.]
MLISDSMSLLWLSYAVLSVLVLIAGYLGLGFLPRLPRLMISWAVAGIMWVPARYTLSLLEQGESYRGVAPAIVVAGLSFLEGDRSAFAVALLVLAAGAAAGAAGGVLLWRLGRGRAEARRRTRSKAGGRDKADGTGAPGRHAPSMTATPDDSPRAGRVVTSKNVSKGASRGASKRGTVRREPSIG